MNAQAVRAEQAAVPRVLDANQQRNAMAGFFQIMRLWNVPNADMRRILGSPRERTFFDWKSGRVRRVQEDVIRRIGYVAGIYKALQILYSDPAQSDEWVRKPNRHFGGQSPLRRMAAGDVTDLAAVRTYLDAARAPWS